MNGSLSYFGLADAIIKGVKLNLFLAQIRLDFVGHDARLAVKRYAGNAVTVTAKLSLMLFQQFFQSFNQSLGIFGSAQNDGVNKSRQHIFGNQIARLKSGGVQNAATLKSNQCRRARCPND